MKRLLIISLLLPFLLTSCFQEEKTFIINPDGTGKVEFKATFPLDSVISLGNEKELTPEKKAKNAVTKIIEESEGVAAWANVSYKINDEGKIEFQGTAYFKDLNKVELKMGSIDSNTLKPTLVKKNGLVTIECALESKNGDKAKPKKDQPKWDEMTEKQQKLAIAKTRQQLQQMKGMLSGMAGDMSTKVTIQLPIPGQKASGFKKLSDSSFSITQTGQMMLDGIDKVLADEKIMQTISGDINMTDEPPAEVMHQMFGFSINPTVSFPATAKPAFDYKKELKAAQKAAPAMMKKLGLSVTPPAPMVGEAKFKSLKVAGIRIVTPAPDQKVRAFNWSEGTSIALIGELPGAVISADEGTIETFTLNNGQDLLSTKKWDQKPRSIDLSEDGTLLGFEVQTDQLPEDGATSIKMLKGEIICMAASSSQTVDLEFAKVAEGEESEHYGAKITKFKESKYNEGQKELSIQFELKRNLIKKVSFFDKDGTELKVKEHGYSWSGKRGTLSFLCDDTLPEDCVIALDLYTDLKQHAFPFKIENSPLIPVSPKSK
ncbi:hypothetical protein HW115_10065 [Verrucomicrobiaceae bacterium N1E253]|uniref:Lipoprotein n=1 Tax=Oceaniferula marina TaxID=2748318 RepID=A0A851GDW6_9BACT|nr:hypothetical protein [Oceaniferula marina]NWK55958.1 hypothetical protein [Oceaniferula marina]